jgi:hypothetical protein
MIETPGQRLDLHRKATKVSRLEGSISSVERLEPLKYGDMGVSMPSEDHSRTPSGSKVNAAPSRRSHRGR